MIFDDLPASAVEAIEAFDPEGTACVIRGMLAAANPVAGRPVYGGRRSNWLALEDKMIIDDFWDAAGVPRAPARIVDLEDEGLLREANAAIDQGLGTVWAGDNLSGLHGVASLVRRVSQPSEIEETRKFFAQRCARVRIMPFLDGIPCSIHGIVCPDAVVALRPCEMLVLRQRGSNRFLWRPRPVP